MRFCFFGTYTVSEGYPVNRVLITGLRRAGAIVHECRQELWGGFLHDIGKRPVRLVRLLFTVPWRYTRLLWSYLRTGEHEYVVVGYAGYFDVLVARLANLRHRRTVILVTFISLYDTIVLDRRRARIGSLKARFLCAVDRLAFNAADLLLVDTNENARYLAELTGVEPAKFVRSFVGEDDVEFSPRLNPTRDGDFNILFFGTYVPLHGIDLILDAAEYLQGDKGTRFTVIGNGQMYPEMRRKASAQGLQNVLFIDKWVGTCELVEWIVSADVCLGIFGTTAKAARVIPYKVYDALAMRKPVITRDSPAIRELLANGESALLTTPGSVQSLVDAIVSLRSEPARLERIATAGYGLYRDRCSPVAIGRTLLGAIQRRKDVTEAVCG